jgi:hypothetical protein
MKGLSVLIGAVALLWADASLADCAKEDSTIELEGTLSREAFPGPPNYQSIDHGDAPEIYLILTADGPREICSTNYETGAQQSIGLVQRFQLSISRKLLGGTLPIIGARTHVKGKIVIGETGHYHTPAALDVVAFESRAGWRPESSPAPADAPGSIPVTVNFRRALVGPSLVAEVKNHTRQMMSLQVSLANPTTGKSRIITFTVPPHGLKQIGHTEGWPFASGDRILLHNASFIDVAIQVP